MNIPELPITLLCAEPLARWSVAIVDNYGARRLRLTIGVQSFHIEVEEDDDPDEPERMEWFREQLAGAMSKLTTDRAQLKRTGTLWSHIQTAAYTFPTDRHTGCLHHDH